MFIFQNNFICYITTLKLLIYNFFKLQVMYSLCSVGSPSYWTKLSRIYMPMAGLSSLSKWRTSKAANRPAIGTTRAGSVTLSAPSSGVMLFYLQQMALEMDSSSAAKCLKSTPQSILALVNF